MSNPILEEIKTIYNQLKETEQPMKISYLTKVYEGIINLDERVKKIERLVEKLLYPPPD